MSIPKAGSVGVAAGPEVAVMAEGEDVCLAPGTVGEIVIRGGNVMTGYEQNETANRQCFADGWFRTGDQGYLDADGYLFLTGRLKELINRGGEKIAPREVEEVLLRHPQIREAVVFAAPDVRLGEAVAAAVVLRSNGHVTPAELRQFAITRLAAFKVPSRVMILDELPKGPTGKLQRIGLAAHLGLTDEAECAAPVVYAAPQTETERRLADLWCDVLRVDQVGLHDSFWSVGGDSILAQRLVLRVQKALGASFGLIDCFDASTVAEQAAVIDAKRFGGESLTPQTGGLTVTGMGTRPETHRAEVSWAQEGMWLADRLEADSPVYNRPSHLRLRGSIDIAILRQSLAELVKRHESLRTAFDQVTGSLLQWIQPPFAIDLPVYCLRHLPPHEQQRTLLQLADELAAYRFDLTQPPLFRAALATLSDHEHILLLVFHHIIFDGWSESVLIDDLTGLYGALNPACPVALPPLSHQYADYAHWQRQHLAQADIDRQLQYWKTKLAQAPSTERGMDLPGHHARPSDPNTKSRLVQHELSPGLVNQLKRLSAQAGVTLYTALLTGFYALLYHATGETDIVVGAPVAGRNRLETEPMIGLFINSLALRVPVAGELAFSQLMTCVHQTVVEALLNQDVAFAQVLQALQLTRAAERHPGYQVMFQLRKQSETRESASGLQVEPFCLQDSASWSRLDWSLNLTETPSSICIMSQYRVALFDHEQVEQLLCDYEAILTQAANAPEISLNTLQPYLRTPSRAPQERQGQLSAEDQRLLSQYGAGPVITMPKGESVVSLFEAQVARCPMHHAVEQESFALTYDELNQRANQLAHHLMACGIGPERVVALCVPRGPHMLIGLLGILKAGAAYLPIDPAYPDERIAAMLREVEPAMLIVHSSLPDRGQASMVPTIVLDTDPILTTQSKGNPPHRVQPHHLAYVIFTSGSTGRPKGVMIEHRSLLNYVLTFAEWCQLDDTDRLLQFASMSFDTAAEEVFTSLARGATLVLRNDAMLATASAFWQTCRDWGITVLDLPTAYWHQLVANEEALAELPSRVRFVAIGGEKAHPQHLATWHRHVAPEAVTLMNGYGPTEATIAAVCDILELCDDPEGRQAVSIGYPMANVQAYVLDTHGQQVPIGCVGELYLAGAGLARGYWRRPAETAAVFVKNPFRPEPEARMYRTGDWVRYRRDGRLEVIGRCDDQVKIRGHRIELGDIEAALLRCPGVREAVVIIREAVSEGQLAAYVVADEDVTAAGIYHDLRQALPVFMLPEAMTLVSSLPLTINGKLDRQALPAPTPVQACVPGRMPETAIEQLLADIWGDVLGCESLDAQQDFFMLGGHSLLALRVMNHAGAQLGIEISLREFVSPPTGDGTPTIENIAALYLEKLLGDLEPETISTLLDGACDPSYPSHT